MRSPGVSILILLTLAASPAAAVQIVEQADTLGMPLVSPESFTPSNYLDQPEQVIVESPAVGYDHPGLLGKSYFRGSFTFRGVELRRYRFGLPERTGYFGFAGEINVPAPSMASDRFATDLFVQLESERLSVDGYKNSYYLAEIGLRRFPHSWKQFGKTQFRPYFGMGVGGLGTRTTRDWGSYDSFTLLTSLSAGVEAIHAPSLSSRNELEALISLEDGLWFRYDGSLNYWLSEKTFLRAGINVPIGDSVSPQMNFGLGMRF